MDATELAAAIKARKISPLEAVDAAIARAQAVQPHINCISEELFDHARRRAAAVDLSTPFAGVPYLIKDEADIVGKARDEFGQRRGADFRYVPLLQRDAPPLDYRRKPSAR